MATETTRKIKRARDAATPGEAARARDALLAERQRIDNALSDLEGRMADMTDHEQAVREARQLVVDSQALAKALSRRAADLQAAAVRCAVDAGHTTPTVAAWMGVDKTFLYQLLKPRT